MKSEIKAKFIQYVLSNNKYDKGFTLIELLIVIILLGVLSAIAMPSFLNQAAKARQSEAKIYIGAINRAQQAYRMENISFAPNSNTLQVGISNSTDNYIYKIVSSSANTVVTATPQDTTTLKGFNGGVTVLSTGQTLTVACQTAGPQANNPMTTPSLTTTDATCTGTMTNME